MIHLVGAEKAKLLLGKKTVDDLVLERVEQQEINSVINWLYVNWKNILIALHNNLFGRCAATRTQRLSKKIDLGLHKLSTLHPLQPYLHFHFIRTIVEGHKPFIPRDSIGPVITIEIAVVQIVKRSVHFYLGLIDFDFFIPAMPPRRADTSMHQMIECMNGMWRNDPVEDRTREVNQMLNGMHR